MIREKISIIEFAVDEHLLGLDLSLGQRTLLKANYGLSLDSEELELYRECTGRQTPPDEPVQDLTAIIGRRGGKNSRIIASIAAYEAFCGGHEKYLAPGEEGVILIVSQVFRRARQTAFGLIRGAIFNSPMLSRSVVDDMAWELGLDNGLVIRCEPCSMRSIRGPAVPVALFDELGFWMSEGWNPDAEVERAVRPAMAQFPNWKLVKASTPWIKAGLLWEDYRDHYGVDLDRHLIWVAPTWIMNPTIPQKFLDREKMKDPDSFIREYGAEFTDTEGVWLPEASVRACVQEWDHLPPPGGGIPVYAVIDPAYKRDTFALALSWWDPRISRVVIGRVEGWKPPRQGEMSPGPILDAMMPTLEAYGCHLIFGDQYTAAPLREAFRDRGLGYEEYTFTASSKAEIYTTLKSLVINELIELPDHPQTIHELQSLRVSYSPGGNMRIAAPARAGMHDDFATVCALGAWLAYRGRMGSSLEGVFSSDVEPLCEEVT